MDLETGTTLLLLCSWSKRSQRPLSYKEREYRPHSWWKEYQRIFCFHSILSTTVYKWFLLQLPFQGPITALFPAPSAQEWSNWLLISAYPKVLYCPWLDLPRSWSHICNSLFIKLPLEISSLSVHRYLPEPWKYFSAECLLDPTGMFHETILLKTSPPTSHQTLNSPHFNLLSALPITFLLALGRPQLSR